MNLSTLFSVADRVALVTGGSSGIGRHIATGLAAGGARVFICGRSVEKGLRAAADIRQATSGHVDFIAADISTMSGIKDLSGEIAAREPRLHILVNNAGALLDAPIDDYPDEGWDHVMALNVKAPFFLVQKLLPLLRTGSTPERPSTVINISSAGAIKIGPLENYAYQASKAGLIWLTRSLAKRLGRENINVTALAPGIFESEMMVLDAERRQTFASMVPRGRLGIPEDMAGAVIFLASAAGAYVNGAVLAIDGGTSI